MKEINYLRTPIKTAATVVNADVMPIIPAIPSFSLGARLGTKISAPGLTLG